MKRTRCSSSGRIRKGQWLAIETHNLGGGLLNSRQDALHFMDFETGSAFDELSASSSGRPRISLKD
jgi:hypothetical protein